MSTISSRRNVIKLTALAACGLLYLPGCGGSGGAALHPVSGKVLVNGKPLTRGAVRFVPDKAKGNTSGVEPAGTITPEGTYTLSTNGKPGAPLGWYKVTVTSTDEPDSTKPLAAKSYVGKLFNSAETTPVSIEVTASPSSPEAYDVKVAA